MSTYAVTAEVTAKFARMVELEGQARTAWALEGMGSDFATRGRAMDWTKRIKAELFPLLDSLSPAELASFIEYRREHKA